jgi:hypothetical protein
MTTPDNEPRVDRLRALGNRRLFRTPREFAAWLAVCVLLTVLLPTYLLRVAVLVTGVAVWLLLLWILERTSLS